MIESKGLIAAIIVTSVCVFTAGGFILYDRFGDMVGNIQDDIQKQQESGETVNAEEPEIEAVVAKENEKQDWVYDADYHLPTKKESYYGYVDHSKLIQASDLVVPYINMDSADAKKANQEIYQIYENLIETFNDNLNDQVWFTVVEYQAYTHDDIVSVIITRETGGTYVPLYEYDAYNFHIRDGSTVSYQEAYTAAGFDQNNIEDAVNKAITKALKQEYDGEEGLNTYRKQSLKNYQKAVEKQTIRFFLDQSQTLHVVVTLSVPDGIGTRDVMLVIS